jgi:hypothetical protein
LPGDTFLRLRIAAEVSSALARDSGFAVLRIEFGDLDAACAAHVPGRAPSHALPRAAQQRPVPAA